MIPIIYEKDEVSFTSNGLGRLRDIIDCKVVEARNDVFECDFSYPVGGANFDLIQLGRIIGVRHDDSDDIQPFDIVSYSKPISGIAEFHAVHLSYRQRRIVAQAKNINTLDDAFRALVETAQPENNFTYESDLLGSNGYVAAFDMTPRSVRQLLGGVEGSILDTFSPCEYEWDKWRVILHRKRGQDRDLTIRYGVNLLEYNEDTDSQETYNSCVPFWKGSDSVSGETIVYGSRVDSSLHTVGGRNCCIPLDLSEKFETKPTVAQLEAMALSVMNSNEPNIPSQTITVDFVRLQDLGYEEYNSLLQCKLCDTIRVVFPEYSMSGRFKIVKTVFDVLAGRFEKMELGTLSTSLAEALGIGGQSIGSGNGVQAADQIIEYGTSGSWFYQKWLSGKAECWARIQQTISSWTAWGSLYYGTPYTHYDYPTDLFMEAPALEVTTTMETGNNGDTIAGVSNNGTATRTPSLYAVRPTSGLTGNVYFMVHAIGKWRSVSPSGGGDVTEVADYELLINKPKVEGVTLIGNKTFEDLTLEGLSNSEIETLLSD